MGSHRVGHDWNDLAAAAAAPGYKFPYPKGRSLKDPPLKVRKVL